MFMLFSMAGDCCEQIPMCLLRRGGRGVGWGTGNEILLSSDVWKETQADGYGGRAAKHGEG